MPGAREKLAEAAGWVEKARSEGWYEPDDNVDRHLPFVVRDLGFDDLSWLATGHSFQVLLDRYVCERRGLRVLEVGAAKAWAAPYWREHGCEYVATDILTDPKIGLGRGAFFGATELVQADGEHLPFADASFDVAYCCATLHHALDLDAMLGELARVTRRGGLVAGLNEGTRALRASADAPGQESEKALGINEHVHTVWAYFWSFVRAGLVVRRVEHSEGKGGKATKTLERIPKVGTTLGTLIDESRGDYSGISIFARKPKRP